MQRRFAIPHDWRFDDVVATLSSKGGGIGYHAGYEDGFIVQLRGSRRWRVWSSEHLTMQFRRSILGDDSFARPDWSRTEAAPLIDCILEPGDAMYTPTLFPHEGTTIAESISLSLAWRGISAYEVLVEIGKLTNVTYFTSPSEAPDELFVIVPDPCPSSDAGAEITQSLIQIFKCLDGNVPHDRIIRIYVDSMLETRV
jgi:ribosomal protein L16 Arg81 hydroxylase